MSRGHHGQLDLGVLEQLLHPLLLRGAARRPGRPGTGSDPAAAGSAAGGTKLGRSICRSATLHSHTASSLSVLGRPGRCLTSLALTSHGLEPVRFQQVERRLPVVDWWPPSPPGSRPARAAGRPSPAATGSSSSSVADLLQPAGPGGPGRAPGRSTTSSALPISSAATRSMISSRSSRLLQHRPSSSSRPTNTAVARRSCKGTANLIRVLEATLKGPRRSSQRPTRPRPRTDQGQRRQRATSTHFQPGTGRPPGRTETSPSFQ